MRGLGLKFRASILALAALVVVGCAGEQGPPRSPVAGEVKLDGAPLPSGKITFAPVEGGAGAFGEISEGAYRFGSSDGPSPGKHKVEIVSVRPTGKKVPSPDIRGETIEEVRNLIPDRYNARTELEVEVKREADNTFRFELSSKSPARRVKR